MKTKLLVNPNIMDIEKTKSLIKTLSDLGVYHDGMIECEPEMDSQVSEIMEKMLLSN